MGGDGERRGSRILPGPSGWHPDSAAEQQSRRWMRVSPGGGIDASGRWPPGRGRLWGVQRDAEGTGGFLPLVEKASGSPWGEGG